MKTLKYLLVGIIFLYVFVDSLILTNQFGIMNLLILAFYLLITKGMIFNHKLTMFSSLIFLVVCLFMFVLDNGVVFEYPIGRLSEWSYFFMIIGVIQLVLKHEDKPASK